MPAFGARSVVCQGRSRSEIAGELKSLSFSVQPACILFPNLKLDLMISSSYVKKIYLLVLLVQTMVHPGVIKDRTYELSLVPSDVMKGHLLVYVLKSEEMC